MEASYCKKGDIQRSINKEGREGALATLSLLLHFHSPVCSGLVGVASTHPSSGRFCSCPGDPVSADPPGLTEGQALLGGQS